MPNPNSKGQKQYDSSSVAGPAAYDPSTKPTVTLSELIALDGEDDVNVEVSGGYEGEVAGVSNNAVEVQVNNVPDPTTHSGSESALNEVDSGADLSAETIHVNGKGY